ncbi:hypothetical protein ACKVMT_13520 [Halobacteriales archaeon Cl-PHB]
MVALVVHPPDAATMDLPDRRTARIATATLVLLLVLPTVVSGVAHVGSDDAPDQAGDVENARNVTFVGVQGGFGQVDDGRVVAIATDRKEVIWSYSGGESDQDVLYYDVDPLPNGDLLFVEQITGDAAHAVRMDWRNGTEVERFEVPLDTHDVDYLGDGEYVVADKYHHRAYVWDTDLGEVTWEYNFSAHYPAYPEAGDDPADQRSGAGGYTHLNDVDAVDNGSAFLLSPRNFDRVILVNRSTKETVWELGEQDAHDVLHAQHNPALLSQDPPTVLVADSENDRVVEYRRQANGSWEQTWEYRGTLHWPRDADRLPNGNTLVVDTFGQRVLEVTANRSVVWEMQVPKMPYDVERLRYGDEPSGPPTGATVANAASSDGGVSVFRDVYSTALWVLPAWIGIGSFYGLVAGVLVSLGWAAVEVGLVVRRRVG